MIKKVVRVRATLRRADRQIVRLAQRQVGSSATARDLKEKRKDCRRSDQLNSSCILGTLSRPLKIGLSHLVYAELKTMACLGINPEKVLPRFDSVDYPNCLTRPSWPPIVCARPAQGWRWAVGTASRGSRPILNIEPRQIAQSVFPQSEQ